MRVINVAQRLVGLPRWSKRLLIVLVDSSLCVLSVWVAIFLRLSEWVPLYGGAMPAVIGSLALALPIFGLMGVYRPVFRHSGGTAFDHILLAAIAYALCYFAVFTAWSVPGVPRTVGIIQPGLLFIFMVLARIGARTILRELLDRSDGLRVLPRVLIYGAGESGRQLAAAITSRRQMKVAGFLDDSKELHGASVGGIRVYSPNVVVELVDRLVVDEVLLAIPSATQRRRNEIIAMLRSLRVNVRTLPDIMEMALNAEVGNLRELDLDDLLGRDTVMPNRSAMNAHIEGQVILVTGAGGSIGSELCRQIMASHPRTLLLLDNNEYALYSIHRELELVYIASPGPEGGARTEVIPLLGSVRDAKRVGDIMASWHPTQVYHAAAYKHVPLVEHNPVQGVENNVFGTLTVARQCIAHQVPHFVLVSTDKAVRPTNIMGATKRLAEMALQALNPDCTTTSLSMVRFGNVLGSSGSVVPLFRQQIMAGGPVTITDERITRFFMTIPEAAQLVIQAGAMAIGGEVFVLDMGEPVKIIDLARNMIELSGLTVRDRDNPFGDIGLRVVGLRPGEKLYEELLIEDAPIVTQHPRIRKALEGFMPAEELFPKLELLQEAVDRRDPQVVRDILQGLVSGFKPHAELVDYIQLNAGTSDTASQEARAASISGYANTTDSGQGVKGPASRPEWSADRTSATA